MWGIGKRGACLWVIALAGPCQADLPLMIDDLLTPEESLRLELGVGHMRNQGYTDKNVDHIALQFGIRYGVLANTEVYGKLTGRASQFHYRYPSTTSTCERLEGWRLQGRNLTLGINHRFSPDTDTPALLGFFDVLAVENINDSTPPKLVHARTWRAGVSTYRSIDPVVLSLTAVYFHAGKRWVDGEKVIPGDIVSLAPNLSFAINDAVSVSGGLDFSYQGKSTERYSIPTTQTGLTLGVSVVMSRRLVAHMAVYTDISGGVRLPGESAVQLRPRGVSRSQTLRRFYSFNDEGIP